jgi:nucleotide-binding universal stress UspA family protein
MSGPQVLAGGRVVVGVDGSESSMQAAVHGARCARRRGLGVLLVHVTPHGGDDARPLAGREVRERYADSAGALVQAAAERVREATGLADVTSSVVEDHPVDGLLALSADAALVVTGRRGTGGLPGLVLGSTAGALVQHALCPVIALPDRAAAVDDATASVVVGVAGRPGDEQVLAFALAEAAAGGAVLRAVHAWRDLPLESVVGGFGPLVDWGAVEAQERQLLADAVAPWRREAPGVAIEEELLRDGAAAALLSASAGAELLVVGHRHRSRLARLGSTTHAVLHRADAPVAVVPILP